MATCTSCGADVSGKKFCPECGTPVQPTNPPVAQATMAVCPRCNGEIKAGAAFCMHCGSSLTAQTAMATAQSSPLTRQCPTCNTTNPGESAFCNNCGQNMLASTAMPANATAVSTAPAPTIYCGSCGKQNAPGMRFCGGCGSPIATSTPAPQSAYPQTGPYNQPSQSYPAPYDQSQYGTQNPAYSQQMGQPQYQQSGQAPYQQSGQPYPQQYGQGQMGYQPQPMVGQQPMVLRCPVCMAMSPLGTANCAGCRTNLAGVVPTPAAMAQQGQMGQQGGIGGFLQGGGGNMAMGALGGAAAVIGGEMLMHGIERDGYGNQGRDEGMLGGLGGLANDIGLF